LIPCLIVFHITGCNGQETQQDEIYSRGDSNFGGTGKFYLDREIAQVMGHRGAGWLERTERKQEERTDLVLEMLPINDQSIVADIGAGSGYYTSRIAAKVPEGKVYAVDIQEEMLDLIRKKSKQLNLNNIKLIKGLPQDPKLPAEEIDLALLVDVYHEFSFPFEMMRELRKSIKDDGKVILLEYRAEDPGVPIKELHKMSEAQAVKELEFAGFKLVENRAELPWQHFLIFEKK